MSAKDKNGVELKVGDRIYFPPNPSQIMLIVSIRKDGLIVIDNNDWPLSAECYVKCIPARTYTEAEMKESFESGAYRNDYEADGCDAEYFAPDFQEFIQSLNKLKP